MRVVQVLSWVIFGGAQVVALLSLVAGRRSSKPRRYAARAAIATVISFSSGFVGTVLLLKIAFDSVADVDASMKATTLAKGISEAMNCVAFGIVSAVFPAIATILLLLKRPTS